MIEDTKRAIILNKARLLYIETCVTKNITEALRLYLKNDAGPDEQVPLFMTSPERHQLKTIMQRIRPTCDECGAELHLQVNAIDPAGKSHPTAWVCTKCGVWYYSELSPADWLKELKLETRKQNLQKPYESC